MEVHLAHHAVEVGVHSLGTHGEVDVEVALCQQLALTADALVQEEVAHMTAHGVALLHVGAQVQVGIGADGVVSVNDTQPPQVNMAQQSFQMHVDKLLRECAVNGEAATEHGVGAVDACMDVSLAKGDVASQSVESVAGIAEAVYPGVQGDARRGV